MQRLKAIQFNADRCKAAILILEKVFIEKYDVAIVQEPYPKHKDYWTFAIHKHSEKAKAII